MQQPGRKENMVPERPSPNKSSSLLVARSYTKWSNLPLRASIGNKDDDTAFHRDIRAAYNKRLLSLTLCVWTDGRLAMQQLV
jgi:hypothetical protein